MIDSFSGQYHFLSNFYRFTFSWRGHRYKTSEHAFQAAKATDRADFIRVKQAASPRDAKRLGRQIRVRDDWDFIRVRVMESVVRAKFSYPELGALLLATGDEELVEGNRHGDRFWGICNGRGANNLGVILMTIREDLRRVQGHE